ncbi:MAG: pyruvate formate-lyase-activating protein [Emergencia sp.]
MTKGRLHSIETFGAVDGPGIRTVFFLQGCPARCQYCHNPDSWLADGGRDVEIDEIVARARRGIPYYGNDGGVTFSGGEPLMQGQFLLDAIEALKASGIGSIIDTSGTYLDEYSEAAIAASDMLLLDIKHVDPEQFEILTGRDQSTLIALIEIINRLEKPVWVRQVILPGYNDTPEYIKSLNEFMTQIRTIDKVELLGYHNMAESKYEKLGLKYRLAGMKPMSAERLKELNKGIKYERK